jgi:C-terminal processing protease CtpA/Prc
MATKMKNSGFVGVELDVDEATGVYTVKKTVPGSPAEGAGIQAGDVLYALNGVRIAKGNHEALEKARGEWKPGTAVTYTIRRNGLDRQVELTLAPMPADVLAAWIGNHMLEHANTELAENTPKKK